MIANQLFEKFILGTVQLGKHYGISNVSGQPTLDDSIQIINLAKKNGIKLFDTAEAYGDSLEILKNVLSEEEISDCVLGKGVLREATIEDAVKVSLKKLNAKKMQMFSLHDFKEIQSITAKDIESLKQKNLLNKFGVSVYTNEELLRAASIEAIDVIQIPFNLLDNWSYRGEAILYAKEKNKEIHCRSIFLQGLFFLDIDKLPTKLIPLRNSLSEIKKIASQYELSIEELAFYYPMSIPEIDKIIFGVENLTQLENNIRIIKNFKKIDQRMINSLGEINRDLLNPSNWT